MGDVKRPITTFVEEVGRGSSGRELQHHEGAVAGGVEPRVARPNCTPGAVSEPYQSAAANGLAYVLCGE